MSQPKRKKQTTVKSSRLRSWLSLRQLTAYLVSGGAYFWAGYALFFVCDKGLHWSLWWAKLTANVGGWTINYLLQRYWVFQNTSLRSRQIEVTSRYVIITLADFMLDYGIIWSLKQLGLTPYLGQFVSAGFFTFWNYLWYRFWVFPVKPATIKRRRLA